jgi:hypothetical protein
MKKKYKKLIFSALAVAIFIPLVSMAANENFSFPEKDKKCIQNKQSFVKNSNLSSIDKDTRILERENRRLENRVRHTEMMNVLESGDYNTWLEFVKDKNCSMTSQVNEENFAEFIDAHKSKIENRNNENREFNKGNFRNKVK